MLPHPKQGQTLQDVFANRSEWMLIDRSRISFDGGECDKVRAAGGQGTHADVTSQRIICMTGHVHDELDWWSFCASI